MLGAFYTYRRRILGKLFISMFALAFSSPVVLASDASVTSESEPSARAARLVVAFAPGTGSDALARLLAEAMTKPLGQSVIVENRPGGGGIVGTGYVARSAPDGNTMTMGTTSTLITNPYLNPAATYSGEKDFKAVAGLARIDYVIVTANTPDTPKTLGELVERLKVGDVNYASSGMGTVVHLTGERFVREVGAKATHIPYQGAAQSVAGVASGVTLFTAETMAAVLPLIQGGHLRALAVTSPERLKALPDVPTVMESGYPDFSAFAWFALMVPAATPDHVVQKLDEAAHIAMGSPEMAERMGALGFERMGLSSTEFDRFFKNEQAAWTGFLDSAGIKLE